MSAFCSLPLSTGGEVANALVCKTSIRGFDPHPVLQPIYSRQALVLPYRGRNSRLFPTAGGVSDRNSPAS